MDTSIPTPHEAVVTIDQAVETFRQFLTTRANSERDTTNDMIKREMPYWIIEHQMILYDKWRISQLAEAEKAQIGSISKAGLDKVCKWLDGNLHFYVMKDHINYTFLIHELRKAMED